ncbi:MAG: response regulator [Pseudobutyrivibrio sp.]|nr:response regulator [Pseudobutyrivibrio sp.]
MYSVFLVEDEIVIRDGLKNSFPWDQYGFSYAGDAADGEMALPLIRQLKPDLIITDIRMPFMDGISLSKMVKKELPGTRIVIISGFDDFSYAQEAISIGVDKYLLKPITKDKLAEVMKEERARLDKDSQSGEYFEQFRQESQEYERFARVRFFNQLVGGTLSVSQVYEKAAELDIALDASHYNLLLLSVTPLAGANRADNYSKHMARLSEQLMQYFMCCEEYAVFHWNLDTYAVIIKGDEESVVSRTDNCIENIQRRCMIYEDEVAWAVAQGKVTTRFSEFPASCDLASRKLSCRYIKPENHIFTDEDLKNLNSAGADDAAALIDHRLVEKFLECASSEEIDGFLENLIPENKNDALNSLVFCQYFAMSIYLSVSDYIKKKGTDPQKVLPEDIRARIERADSAKLRPVVHDLFAAAISLREGESTRKYKGQLLLAMQYVDQHFMDAALSLNEVAKEVNISPSYLSAMFSREAETTFVEYMTTKRMEEAVRLLKTTEDKTAVIADKVGYKDPHYFSYIFKKTYGLSPKEYRVQENS